jgi:NADH dehydrogenase FAD-containing subunit
MSKRPTNPQTVVIIGMGDTGVLVATRLSRHFNVVGISTKPNLVSGQELGKRLADLSWWNRYYNTPLRRFKALVDVEIHHAKAERVDLINKTVVVVDQRNDETLIDFDFLVIASGTSNGFWRDDHLLSEAEIDERLEQDAAAVRDANTVAIVGGGPCGVSCALNIRRAYPEKPVSLYISADLPLPGYHEEARQYYHCELTDAGVQIFSGCRAIAEEPAPSAGTIRFESGQSAVADAIIWSTGNRKPHTQFLHDALLDDEGFVKTKNTLEVVGSDCLFAIGDVASTDPARSSARNWAYGILVNNIKRKAAGKAPNKHYAPPANRWGSIVGPQDDGLTLHQDSGKKTRLSRWLVDNLLLPTVVQRVIYRGVERLRG